MNTIVKVLMGLVVGYIIGIALGGVAAFVLGFEDAARFIAIGFGLAGAIFGPVIIDRLQGVSRPR